VLSAALRCYRPRDSTFQPPDQPAADDQTNRNQLRSGHHSAEDFASARVTAQEFDEVALDPVEDHETGKYLSIEFLSLEQPHQENEVKELSGGFDQLSRLQSFVEWCAGPTAGQRVGEDHAPEVIGRFAVAASSGEASEASQHVTEGESGSESIAGAQSRHVAPSHVPRCHEKRADQAAGKNAAGLQRVEAEDLAPVAGVCVPFVNDEQDLCTENAGKNHEDSQVPGVITVDALLFRIADADPQPDQDSGCDQQAVGRKAEITNVEQSR
jgi:hypothetical protein